MRIEHDYNESSLWGFYGPPKNVNIPDSLNKYQQLVTDALQAAFPNAQIIVLHQSYNTPPYRAFVNGEPDYSAASIVFHVCDNVWTGGSWEVQNS